MPKLKTNKGAAKRFRLNKKGRVKRWRGGKGHILTKKSGKRRRHLRKSKGLSNIGSRLIRKLMPYG